MSARDVDAVVVGSGPNGLAAAIVLAQAGRSVRVLEAAPTIGGGTRSEALTLPGFRHDVCSAIHPLGLGSPFLRGLPLAEHGLAFVQPEIPLAHPFDDGSAVALHRSVDETAEGLGVDADAYRRLMQPLVDDFDALMGDLLGPLRPPRHPIAAARFGLSGLRSATGLARSRFAGTRARALFAGNAAHSMQPLEQRTTAAFGLVLLLLGHAVGWPAAVGGSQAIADAMASLLRSLGGEIQTGVEVRSLDELAEARSVLLDVSPRQVLAICGEALPLGYRRSLGGFRYGPGIFKLDYALDGPLPWSAPECRRAGTVHLGGTLEEIAAGEREVARGRHPRRPYVLVAQQSLFDGTRAPAGSHTLWAYCHVPNGSSTDMSGSDRGSDRALRPRLPRASARPPRHGPRRRPGPERQLHRRRHLTAGPPRCASSGPVRCCDPCRTPRRTRASSSARPRHLRVAACTGCAGCTLRVRRCAASFAEKL